MLIDWFIYLLYKAIAYYALFYRGCSCAVGVFSWSVVFSSNKSVTFSSLLQPTESVIPMDSIYESCVHPVNPYSKQFCGNRTHIFTNLLHFQLFMLKCLEFTGYGDNWILSSCWKCLLRFFSSAVIQQTHWLPVSLTCECHRKPVPQEKPTGHWKSLLLLKWNEQNYEISKVDKSTTK